MPMQKTIAVLLGMGAALCGLLIAVALLIGLAYWTFSAGSNRHDIDRHDINVPRAIGALALTQQHASYWEPEATRKKIFEEMLDGLAKSTEVDARWRSYFVRGGTMHGGEAPNEADAADMQAIQQLQGNDRQREHYSADGRHYVRVVSYGTKCTKCHTLSARHAEVSHNNEVIAGYLVVRMD
ncbi:MAG: hypothetical protein RIC55_07620 [Pirellulaceae bacterium]